jgi:hypothetical protein
MKEAAVLFEEFLQPFHFSQPKLQFIANSSGRVAALNEINAKYFANQMMLPVLFEESLESLNIPIGSILYGFPFNYTTKSNKTISFGWWSNTPKSSREDKHKTVS